jgi:hypothetical protein
MVKIVRFDTWKPFHTEQGNYGVFRLFFDYDQNVINAVRTSIKKCQMHGQPQCGGWLPNDRAWFVKVHVLPALKIELSKIDVQLLPK